MKFSRLFNTSSFITKENFFRKVLTLTIICLLSVPLPIEAQKRQRSKSKAKTSAAIKKNNPSTSAEAKKRQAETQKEIKLTEEQIRENESKVKKSLASLGKIDQEISATNKKIKELNGRISKLGSEITSLESSIASNEKDLEKLRSEYLKAVKKMRVSKKNKSTLAFIFSSKSVNQAMRRMRYLREFSSWRERQTEEINAKTNDLKNQRDALAKAQEEQTAALSLQKNAVAQLDKQHSQQEAIVADLKQNGAALNAHLKKKQAEALELNNLVSQLIAQEQRKAEEEAKRLAEEQEAQRKAQEEEAQREAQNAQNQLAQENTKKNSEKTQKSKSDKKNKETKETDNTSYASARKRAPRSKSNSESVNSSESKGSFADMKGKLQYPTTGSFSITSRFGRQSMPDLPDVVYDNPGIDAESDAGASARAVFKGKVSGVYLLPGYNTVVIVNHGNYYTVYGNIATPGVKNGDAVDAGTPLGKLALNDDDSSHSSIHFEVWKNRDKLNPQDWLH